MSFDINEVMTEEAVRDSLAKAVAYRNAEIRADALQEAIDAVLDHVPESGAHINMTSYRDGKIDGFNAAIRSIERLREKP